MSLEEMKTWIYIIGFVVTLVTSWGAAWFTVRINMALIKQRLEKVEKEVEENHREHSGNFTAIKDTMEKMNVLMGRIDERTISMDTLIREKREH